MSTDVYGWVLLEPTPEQPRFVARRFLETLDVTFGCYPMESWSIYNGWQT